MTHLICDGVIRELAIPCWVEVHNRLKSFKNVPEMCTRHYRLPATVYSVSLATRFNR
ncbi:hypothetical protein L873DRAFT_1811556 [Choiromyces venosus 120613-1]|uniref:Uncharacterized protein n=1 Tax=Choiromyces venosus 120613-1 TaxID=1336337 RepID=A0A3N4JDQ3_9PEZI|nr:hypothetical protein L873DRAFT_1811556 [Choiromyces venosus 120613-1]